MINSSQSILEILRNYNAPETSRQRFHSATLTEFRKYLPATMEHEYLDILSPFVLETPQKFYREDVLLTTWKLLNDAFAKNPDHTISIIRHFDDQFHYGFDHLLFLCELINNVNFDSLDRRAKFDFAILPWYVKALEGIFAKVVKPVLAATLLLKENEMNLKKIEYFPIKTCYDKFKKYGFHELIEGCNLCVRNSIAHQQFVFEDKMFEAEKLIFKDDNETKVLFDKEVIELFEFLLDTCSGIIVSFLLFYFNHLKQIKSTGISGSYQIPFALRQQLVRNAVRNDLVEVMELKKDVVNNTPIIAIEIIFKAYTIEEEFLEAMRILHILHAYYPKEDYNIKIKNPRTKEKLHWLIIDNKSVKSFFDGKISDEEFFKRLSERSLLPSFSLFYGRKRATFRRMLLFLASTIKSIKTRKYEIPLVEDRSTGNVRRYSAQAIVPPGLTQEEIKKILADVMQDVRKRRIYKTKIIKKYWKGQAPEIIWIGLFTKEKRARDMIYLDFYDYYVCHTEWTARGSKNGIFNSYDEICEGIKVIWNKKLYPNSAHTSKNESAPIVKGYICETEELLDFNLWDKPGGIIEGSSVIGNIRKGSQVTILKSEDINGNKWYFIKADKFSAGQQGWILKEFLKIDT